MDLGFPHQVFLWMTSELDLGVKEPHLGVNFTEHNLWGLSHYLCGPRYYLVLGLSVCTCCNCFSDFCEGLSFCTQPLCEIYEKERSNTPLQVLQPDLRMDRPFCFVI